MTAKKTKDTPRRVPRPARKLTPEERKKFPTRQGKFGGTLYPFQPKNKETGEYDPRANVAGTANSIGDLRKVIQTFLNQSTGRDKTRLLKMLEDMVRSKMALDRKTLMEYGFGKVPDVTKHEGEIVVKGYVTISPDDWDVDPVTRTAKRKRKKQEEEDDDSGN